MTRKPEEQHVPQNGSGEQRAAPKHDGERSRQARDPVEVSLRLSHDNASLAKSKSFTAINPLQFEIIRLTSGKHWVF
jgi:hypothetical protein